MAISNPIISAILKSKVGHLNQHLKEGKAPKKIQYKLSKSKNVSWMEFNLKWLCREHGLKLLKEHRFHSSRKYRFDFAIDEIKLGIEYQGGIYMRKSGHSNAAGATRDSQKANLATSLGWKVLTFTAANFKEVIQEVKKHIK